MSSVVLSCKHCNARSGLWNYTGLRPVAPGRLTVGGPAGGRLGGGALPRGGSAGGAGPGSPSGGGGGVLSLLGPAPADPLSATIAGARARVWLLGEAWALRGCRVLGRCVSQRDGSRVRPGSSCAPPGSAAPRVPDAAAGLPSRFLPPPL
jgi:hypothetical protein